MDIGSGSGWPSSALSNFAGHRFVLDGVECASMEGFLQSLKFDKEHIQVEVCKLIGKAAKFRGKRRNKAWKQVQTLWWKGAAYDRHSDAYQELLDRAYAAMFEQSASFKTALLAAGGNGARFTHSMGSSDPRHTVLTEREFCSRLQNLHARFRQTAPQPVRAKTKTGP